MTDAPKIERITRSLAFMLRHQPDKFDLDVDAHGFAEVDEVVRALNERLGEPVDEDDVVEAMGSGDRTRYEIQGTKIRALYGHSIPVEPGTPARPPEVLYVAIPERDADRAARFGLRGGRRRFLHLARSVDDARETGKRAARNYTVLRIRALDAWEEGINFFDRISLWLAEEVPTHLIEVEGTFDDGTDPERRPRRNGRDGRRGGDRRGGRREGRGRGRRGDSDGDRERSDRGRGRDRDRGRGRGRDRDRDRRDAPEREEQPVEASRPKREDRDRGRGRERSRDRDRGRDRGRDRAPARERDEKPAAPKVVAKPKAKPAPEPAVPFGLGIHDEPEPKPAPEPPPVVEEPVVEPEPAPEPEPTPKDDGLPGFGAGL